MFLNHFYYLLFFLSISPLPFSNSPLTGPSISFSSPHHPNLLFHSSISRYHPVPQTFLLFIPTTPSSKGYSGYSFLIILRKNFSIWMLCSMDHVDAWDAGEKRWCMCLIRKRKKKHKRKRPKNSLREIKLHNHSTIIVLINHILNNIMLFFISPNPYLLIYCYSW